MPVMIVSLYCWATCLLLCTFDKNSNRQFLLFSFHLWLAFRWHNSVTWPTNLGNLISQSGLCSCLFEELEERSDLPVCLHSMRFWRVKARQRWSVLIEEVRHLGRNTSVPCDMPWKRFCCSTSLPFTFLLHSSYETLWWKMLFLWRKPTQYVAVVDAETVWLNHKLSFSVPSSCICCHISCSIDTAGSTVFRTFRKKQIFLRKYRVTKWTKIIFLK